MESYFIAGGTSELGNRVVYGLTKGIAPDKITCMVRTTSNPTAVSYLQTLGIKVVTGDVTEPGDIQQHLDIHATYIDMTHPKYYNKSIDAIIAIGVKRAFFVTTTGIFSKYRSASEIYKFGERRIKASGVPYTILRPSMIYGTDRDRNMTKLLRILSHWPVFPVFGSGEWLMQPVYVQDLAEGVVTAVLNPTTTENKEYNLCGPEALTYLELLHIAREELGSRVRFVHIPHKLATVITAIGEKIPGFPIKKEQVQRLLEDKCFDISAAQKDLGYSARVYRDGICEEISYLRKKGII